jgi:hypothetical protein
MDSLDLHYIGVVCSKMCTDTPLVPVGLPPPICLVVPVWHPPPACLSAPYWPAIPLVVLSRHPLFSEGWLYALTIYPPHCVTHEKGISCLSCSMVATVFMRLLASRPLSQAYYYMTLSVETRLRKLSISSPVSSLSSGISAALVAAASGEDRERGPARLYYYK